MKTCIPVIFFVSYEGTVIRRTENRRTKLCASSDLYKLFSDDFPMSKIVVDKMKLIR